jgi:hypothetical protein
LYLRTSNDLDVFEGKMFGMWEGNHRVITWRRHIDTLHQDDFQWCYTVDCIYLFLVDFISVSLDAMHNVNMWL